MVCHVVMWWYSKVLKLALAIIVFILADAYFHGTRPIQSMYHHGSPYLGICVRSESGQMQDPASWRRNMWPCDITMLSVSKARLLLKLIYCDASLKCVSVGCRYLIIKLTISQQSRKNTESCHHLFFCLKLLIFDDTKCDYELQEKGQYMSQAKWLILVLLWRELLGQIFA